MLLAAFLQRGRELVEWNSQVNGSPVDARYIDRTALPGLGTSNDVLHELLLLKTASCRSPTRHGRQIFSSTCISARRAVATTTERLDAVPPYWGREQSGTSLFMSMASALLERSVFEKGMRSIAVLFRCLGPIATSRQPHPSLVARL